MARIILLQNLLLLHQFNYCVLLLLPFHPLKPRILLRFLNRTDFRSIFEHSFDQISVRYDVLLQRSYLWHVLRLRGL